MIGEGGKDRFVFATVGEIGGGFSADEIMDFKRGQDRVDLSAIDAYTTRAGNQAFTWKQLKKSYYNFDDGAKFAEVAADVNKDGEADFMLVLSDVAKLRAADFIL